MASVLVVAVSVAKQFAMENLLKYSVSINQSPFPGTVYGAKQHTLPHLLGLTPEGFACK